MATILREQIKISAQQKGTIFSFDGEYLEKNCIYGGHTERLLALQEKTRQEYHPFL